MASRVDIWNLALSHIGHRAGIADPDEVTAEANHCRRFYPFALRIALERFLWSFATRRISLAQVTNPVDHWMFAYAMPTGVVKARSVLLPESTDDSKEQDFAVESADDGSVIILTNVEDAVLKYTARVEDTNKFTPMFAMVLSYDLASMLCGPIPKDIKLKKAMFDTAMYYTGVAEAADANASRSSSYGDNIPAHLSVR